MWFFSDDLDEGITRNSCLPRPFDEYLGIVLPSMTPGFQKQKLIPLVKASLVVIFGSIIQEFNSWSTRYSISRREHFISALYALIHK